MEELAIKLLLLACMFVTGLGVGWHLKGNADAAATLKVEKQEVKQGNLQNATDAKSAQVHETKRAQMETHDRVIIQQVALAAAAPDYHTCQLKPDDLDMLNQAIGGIDAKGK